MIDLTPLFLDADQARNNVARLQEVLKDFTVKYSYPLDWDVEDGESWGRLLNDNKSLILFHSFLPVVFIDVSRFQLLKAIPEGIYG